MTSRKALSKSIRFEVFKRDGFSCQYCGAKAPDVVLHCDHIHPVAKGGTNEIINLITACQSCNQGKAARPLDDKSKVIRQRAQIEELDRRREQLEMMLAWRDESQAKIGGVVLEISDRIADRSGATINENGRNRIKGWLKRYEVSEILNAVDESFDRYSVFVNDEITDASFETAFRKITTLIMYERKAKEKPYLPRLAYIQGILRNRIGQRNGRYLEDLEEILCWGVSLDQMEEIAKSVSDFDEYCNAVIDAAEGTANG